jgi:hypothetical protein
MKRILIVAGAAILLTGAMLFGVSAQEVQPTTEATQPESVPAEELQPVNQPWNIPWLWLGMGLVLAVMSLLLFRSKPKDNGKYGKT